MYPGAEQILAYRASDKEKRIGGLFLEVKGDFCHKVRDILKRHDRAEDYVEIGLGSEYRYNPLNNDLDAYALAYNIASTIVGTALGTIPPGRWQATLEATNSAGLTKTGFTCKSGRCSLSCWCRPRTSRCCNRASARR